MLRGHEGTAVHLPAWPLHTWTAIEKSKEIHGTNSKKHTGFRQIQMSKRPLDDPLAIMLSSRDEVVWRMDK